MGRGGYVRILGEGGGALRYCMATHCQNAARSGSGERQNLGVVNSFEGKKGKRLALS